MESGSPLSAYRLGAMDTRPSTQPHAVSLAEQIAAWIGDRIVRGVIAPGQRVTEEDVSRTFQVSRAPVREAFRILERRNLLVIHPRKGANASEFSAQDIGNIAQLRSVLYRFLGETLATDASAEFLAVLDAKIRNLLKLADNDESVDEFIAATHVMAVTMSEAAGNGRITDILESLLLHTVRYARIAAVNRPARIKSARLWWRAVRAIKRRDPLEAGARMAAIPAFTRKQSVRALEQREEARRRDSSAVQESGGT